MATMVIELSGLAGLGTKFQGDLYSTTPRPNLRYLMGDSQMAGGFWNPFKNYGYLSPANKSITAITGSPSARLISSEYDPINDVAYFAESSNKLLKLDGLDDTSLAAAYTITNTERIYQDLEMYQINGTRVLLAAISADDIGNDRLSVGFIELDENSGPSRLDLRVVGTGRDVDQNNFSAGGNVKFAQSFDPIDVGLEVRKLRLRLAKGLVSPDYNFKVSIQTDSAGSPNGTDLVSVTKSTSILKGINREGDDVYFDFGTSPTLNLGTTYWVVIEPVTVGDLANGSIYWYSTESNEGFYTAGVPKRYNAGTWQNLKASTNTTFDVSFIASESSTWWTQSATGEDDTTPINIGLTNFLQKADNGFCYWFTGNYVHKLDGGLSGGPLGTITTDVLIFPSYFSCVDAIDTNGLMYIAVQASPALGSTTTRSYLGDTCGVYVWDRQTTITRTRDFIPFVGVREIRKIFQTREGDIRAIVINNDREVEIKSLSNGTWQTLWTLGVDAYPQYRDSLTVINNYVVWQAKDGKIYASGKATAQDKEGLFIIGDISTNSSGTFTPGILLTGDEVVSGQQQALFNSWNDGSTAKLSKWYPHGTGTIDSVSQLPHQGDIYSPVYFMPQMSTIQSLLFYCIPGETNNTDIIATIKIYFNQSTTASMPTGMTKTITKADIVKGYFQLEVNKPYVNSVQVEIEYNTAMPMGTSDFCPSNVIVQYEPTKTSTKSTPN